MDYDFNESPHEMYAKLKLGLYGEKADDAAYAIARQLDTLREDFSYLQPGKTSHEVRQIILTAVADNFESRARDMAISLSAGEELGQSEMSKASDRLILGQLKRKAEKWRKAGRLEPLTLVESIKNAVFAAEQGREFLR